MALSLQDPIIIYSIIWLAVTVVFYLLKFKPFRLNFYPFGFNFKYLNGSYDWIANLSPRFWRGLSRRVLLIIPIIQPIFYVGTIFAFVGSSFKIIYAKELLLPFVINLTSPYLFPILFFTFLIHEVFHGIVARAEKVPVNSTGVLYIPFLAIAAYVQVDYEFFAKNKQNHLLTPETSVTKNMTPVPLLNFGVPDQYEVSIAENLIHQPLRYFELEGSLDRIFQKINVDNLNFMNIRFIFLNSLNMTDSSNGLWDFSLGGRRLLAYIKEGMGAVFLQQQVTQRNVNMFTGLTEEEKTSMGRILVAGFIGNLLLGVISFAGWYLSGFHQFWWDLLTANLGLFVLNLLPLYVTDGAKLAVLIKERIQNPVLASLYYFVTYPLTIVAVFLTFTG